MGKSYTTSSCRIPQDRKVARVYGWAVRYQAYPFLSLYMLIEPTYTAKQYWLTILSAGFLSGILSSATYFVLYWFFYVQHSFIFSLIYLIPLLGSTVTTFFFKQKYVWKEFSYSAAFSMSFLTGLLSAIILSLALYIAYSSVLESRIDLFNNVDNETLQRLMSPKAVSLSMLSINVILSLLYSLIIAIFAKRKIKE